MKGDTNAQFRILSKCFIALVNVQTQSTCPSSIQNCSAMAENGKTIRVTRKQKTNTEGRTKRKITFRHLQIKRSIPQWCLLHAFT